MSHLTIDNLNPETERKLRELADRSGKSLSQLVGELLDELTARSALPHSPSLAAEGPSTEIGWDLLGAPSADRRQRFAAIREGLSEDDLAGFDEALAEMRQVNPEDWK